MPHSKATLYDLRTKNIDKDRLAIEKLIGPNASVLEVGCGTGRILQWLAARGQAEIIGIERRSDLLELAKEKLQQAANVHLVNEDLINYHPSSKVEHVLFAFNVLGEFEDMQKRIAALGHAKSLLKPDGSVILINDMPDTNDGDNDKVEYRFSIGAGPDIWEVSITCSRDSSTQTSCCDVTYKNASGDLIADQYRLSSLSRNELIETYEAAALHIEQEYGAYTLGPLEKNYEVLIHVLK